VAAPYEVACACGRVLRGRRQARHQELPCEACGQPVFILAYSALAEGGTANGGSARTGAPPAPDRGVRRSPWLWPLLAALATLAVVVSAFGIGIWLYSRQPPARGHDAVSAPDFEARLKAGRNALAAGRFRSAADELQQAEAVLESLPERRRGAEGRDAAQLRRQAALLADLLSESLGEVLQLAAGSHEEEWQAKFAQDYRGRAVVFDADVTRDGAGQCRLDYHVRAGPEPARIEVGDLKLLRALPAMRPPRLLFGARLAGVSREAGGVWVVRFQPDSGVLLTDLGAVTVSCPPPIDEDLLDLVRRQKGWLDDAQ
jgi:hypothetical protein